MQGQRARPCFELRTRHVTSSPMLMTVELGQGPYKEILASSENGEYSDAIAGIRIPDFDARPEHAAEGGIWIVIERVGNYTSMYI